MVFEKAKADIDQAEFLIRPNKSMTVRGMVVFVCLVGLAVLLVAVRFVLLGAWVVLPFAILEVALLAVGFWLYERTSRYRETVKVSRKNFIITKDSVRGRETSRFDSYWVKVILRPDPVNWYPSHLFVRSRGKQVEIGACLTNQERKELSKALIQYINRWSI